jgi:hypothetical protein
VNGYSGDRGLTAGAGDLIEPLQNVSRRKEASDARFHVRADAHPALSRMVGAKVSRQRALRIATQTRIEHVERFARALAYDLDPLAGLDSGSRAFSYTDAMCPRRPSSAGVGLPSSCQK